MLSANDIERTREDKANSKRRWQTLIGNLAGPIIGVFIGLIIGAILILIAKADPIQSYATLFRGTFGGLRQITDTLVEACPIMIIGLGMSAAFRARVWNIGAEGQYFIGALFGGLVALYLPPYLPRLS